MHNLHFVMVNADSHEDAASTVTETLHEWGDENNWRSVGGIASEDGSDDVENLEDGGWPLSFLDGLRGVPGNGTYFDRALAYLNNSIGDPVELGYRSCGTFPNLRLALDYVGDSLRDFDPDRDDAFNLWIAAKNVRQLSELVKSRRSRDLGDSAPQFFDWQFDEFGLTDLTETTQGARRYIVFLDMHS